MARKRIYTAGPITKGDLLHNIRQADEVFFVLLKAGFAPFNPMWSCFAGSAQRMAIFDGDVTAVADPLPGGTTHEDWMGVDLPWVQVADVVLRLPGESVGADREVAHALSHGIPVFHSLADVVEWGRIASAA